MKYRIKIITYQNGRKTYSPYVKSKSFFGMTVWLPLNHKGEPDAVVGAWQMGSREDAFNAIDKHFCGNTKVQSIEFEYINK